jgi:hypothetical protein
MVRSALIAGIGIFCSNILSAAHVHCAVIPWSAPVIGTLPTVPTDYGGTDAGLTFFRVFISVPAPPIQGPGCGYEISDVTSISVTLTLTGGPITWDHFELSAQAAPNNVTFPGGGAFGGTGTGTIIETLPPHQSPGAYEFTASTTLSFTFFAASAIPAGITITGASGTASGSHYFVPEPGSFALIAVPLLWLWRRRVNWMASLCALPSSPSSSPPV